MNRYVREKHHYSTKKGYLKGLFYFFFKENSCKIPSQTPHDDDTKEGA